MTVSRFQLLDDLRELREWFWLKYIKNSRRKRRLIFFRDTNHIVVNVLYCWCHFITKVRVKLITGWLGDILKHDYRRICNRPDCTEQNFVCLQQVKIKFERYLNGVQFQSLGSGAFQVLRLSSFLKIWFRQNHPWILKTPLWNVIMWAGRVYSSSQSCNQYEEASGWRLLHQTC